MKVSYNWLKDFIDFDVSPDHLSEILTNLGLEVEKIKKIESIKGGLEGIFVGHVIECYKHPNADRLKLTKVKIDKDNILQIICGAPNVSSNQKVAVATVGTILYDQSGKEFKITKSKIRGELSMGMICSEKELGISDNHDGIFVLKSSIKAGTPLKEIIKSETDHVFDIGLTPNRSDAMSHMGIARDLKAVFDFKNINYKNKKYEVNAFKIDNNSTNIPIEILNPKKCYNYHGLTISNVIVEESPEWLKNRLTSIDITPKNNIVDITNYALHHLGQPLHAFNADIIKNKIIVKECDSKTKFKTLDGVERLLDKEDLMICDDEKPLCIAGVFGGENSGINNNTTNIFLESACFEPTTIRKTAKRHSLSTDASYRFERGVDPELTLFTLKFTASLIKSICGGKISSEIQSFSNHPKEKELVDLKLKSIDSLIGEKISLKFIISILESLEIKIIKESKENLLLKIPYYRVDVTRPADVIEEILRIYGYNNLKSSNLKHLFKPKFDLFEPAKVEKSISNFLISNGFNEVLNNSLTSSNKTKDKLNDSIALLNPLSSETSFLRQSMINSMLDSISYNTNRQNKDLKLFEFGNVYFKKEKYIETQKLCISLFGNIFDENWNVNFSVSKFYYLKGVISNILDLLKIYNYNVEYFKNSFFSEGVLYKTKGLKLIEMGLLDNKLLNNYDIKGSVYIAEFDWNNIIKLAYKQPIKYKNLSKQPSSRRDFSLLINDSVNFNSIKKIAFKTDSSILKTVNLFDYYKGKEIPSGKKSYGVSFSFQDEKRTLTDKEIDSIMDKLFVNLQKELKAELR